MTITDRNFSETSTGVLIGAGIAALSLAAAVSYLVVWEMDAFLAWKQQAGFGVFFTGLALLPLIGVPITPLLVLAGATFELIPALLGCALSIAINLALSYGLARYGLRKPLTRLLAHRRYHLPRFEKRNAIRSMIVIRLLPGVPMFLKTILPH